MSIESELYSSVSSANISLEQDKVCGMSFTYKTKRRGPQNRALRHTCHDISPIGESTIDDYSVLSIIKEITQPQEDIAIDAKKL